MSELRRSASHALWIGVLSVPIAWLLSQIVAIVLGWILGAATGATSQDALQDFFGTEPGFLVAILLGQGAFALVLGLALWHGAEPIRTRLGLRFDHERWRGELWVWLAFGTLGVKFFSGALMAPFLPADNEYGGAIQAGLSQAGVITGIGLVVLMSVLPAFIEEGLFRGFMLRGMLRGFPPGLTIAITALVFSFAHPDFNYALMLIPIACWLGWVCYRTNSLLPAMWCHFVNNFFGSSMGLYFAQADINFAEIDTETIPKWIPLLIFGVFVFCVICLFRSITVLKSFPTPIVQEGATKGTP